MTQVKSKCERFMYIGKEIAGGGTRYADDEVGIWQRRGQSRG